MYILIGIVIVLITGSLCYVATNYNEFKLRYLMRQKKTVSFRLDAPEEMTTYDFEQATKEIKKRADAFAGGDYLMETDPASIMLTIPEEYFQTDMEGRDKRSILYDCFAFGGRWRLHNLDFSEFLDLSPSNIVDVELNYGTIPIVSTSGEPSFYNGESYDWSTEEGYYIRITVDEEASSLLKDCLNEKGYLFVVMAHSDTDRYTHPRTWISGGDGKTAYYYIGTHDEKNIAETMFQVLSGESFSVGLDLIWTDEDVTWSTPGKEDFYQRSVDDLGTTVVEIISEVLTDWDEKMQKGIDFCKLQLSTLEIPYALGSENNTIHIRIPGEKINKIVMVSLFDPSISIRTTWNDQIYDGFDNTEITILNQNKLKIVFDEYDFAKLYGENERLFLYLCNVKIGNLESINAEEKSAVFDLLFEDDEKAIISSEKMTEYIYNILKILIRLAADGMMLKKFGEANQVIFFGYVIFLLFP